MLAVNSAEMMIFDTTTYSLCPRKSRSGRCHLHEWSNTLHHMDDGQLQRRACMSHTVKCILTKQKMSVLYL